MQPRPYQEASFAQLREAFRSHKRVVLCLPTGAGKSLIFSWIAKASADNGKRVLILTHRQELKEQAKGYQSENQSLHIEMVETFWNRIKSNPDTLTHYDLLMRQWYRDWETDRKSTRLNSSHRL